MHSAEAEPNRARIGLVSDHLFPFAHGGAERVYRVLADALAANGAELTYFTRKQWNDGAALETAFQVEAVWSGNVYDQHGTRRVGASLLWSLAVLRRLWSAKLDVLIVSSTPVFNVFVGALAKLRHPRMVLVVDWLEIWPWAKWRSYSGGIAGTIAWILQSVAVHIGSVRLVNSATTRGRLPAQSRAQAHALPLASMAGVPAQSAGVVSDSLLFVGRHIPDKNLPLLPEVIAKLSAEFQNLSAVVAGDGPDRVKAEQRAEQCNVAERIRFVGRVSDAELERLLESSGALFFPSVREGFGLVVCEAARFGTPSIVVDHPDNAAVALIAEGVNGAIARSATVDELVSATRRVLQGGAALRTRTHEWYAADYSKGGFEMIAQRLIALSRR